MRYIVSSYSEAGRFVSELTPRNPLHREKSGSGPQRGRFYCHDAPGPKSLLPRQISSFM